jgi:hypothetical protein
VYHFSLRIGIGRCGSRAQPGDPGRVHHDARWSPAQLSGGRAGAGGTVHSWVHRRRKTPTAVAVALQCDAVEFDFRAALRRIKVPIAFAVQSRGASSSPAVSIPRRPSSGRGSIWWASRKGCDFYPAQTIQPFAVLDTLARTGLSTSAGATVTAFDLSPAVLAHINGARSRAEKGSGYALVLPRNLDQPWTPELVKYRDRFGDQIGAPVSVPAPPAHAGRVHARGVAIRPALVRAIDARDLNIVLERAAPAADIDRFDIVIATSILRTTMSSSSRWQPRISRACCDLAGSCSRTTGSSSFQGGRCRLPGRRRPCT